MLFNSVVILLVNSIYVQAAPVRNPQCPSYCKGTANRNNTEYICGDARLGPLKLPTALPLSNDLYDYDRFGGQCPGAFLETWYDKSAHSYTYPPLAGFQATTSGGPLEGQVQLPAGSLIDRFGSEYGSYFAPYGTPYDQRALPPSNLNTYDGQFPYNYHVYEVLKPLVFLAGPILPWFDQPGQGTQYQANATVRELITDGLLRRVSTEELLAPGLGQ